MTVEVAERDALRRRLRARRRALGPRETRIAALRIASKLERLPCFRHARSIAGYWAVDGEADVLEAMRIARARGARTYLPVVSRRVSGDMRFAPWTPGTPMVRNRFGIPEPRSVERRYASASSMDVVLVPLIAFDDAGNRLGMGGGYYDRCFESATRSQRLRPKLVGVGYAFQRVTAIARASWDLTLSWLVTDATIERCRETGESL